MVYDELVKVLDKQKLDDKSLEVLIKNGSFSKIYAYCITKLDSIKKNNYQSDEGIWKKYNQGSDPKILFNDIHGKGTGWCTAGGLKTATSHLNGGDFYVYFTKNELGEYTNPRVAIRTEFRKIAEIRGIAQNQNLESNMEKVASEKLKEFPDREEYAKKVKDMEMLTYIYTKWQNKEELTNNDLRFVYEIDGKIIGFGYKKDPRIAEILSERNKRKDLANLLNCKEENISFTKEEALSGNIKYHFGDLDLSDLESAEGLVLPETVNGDLKLDGLESAEGLVLPETVNGSLNLSGLKSAEGLVLPETVNGSLILRGLKSAEGLKLPYDFDISKLYMSKTVKKELIERMKKQTKKDIQIEIKNKPRLLSILKNGLNLIKEDIRKIKSKFIK